jgi:hypothetical protein
MTMIARFQPGGRRLGLGAPPEVLVEHVRGLGRVGDRGRLRGDPGTGVRHIVGRQQTAHGPTVCGSGLPAASLGGVASRHSSSVLKPSEK